MRIKHVFIGAIISFAGAAFAFAQSAPPPPALPTPSAQSAVHVTTRIVQVSVTVHDDQGRPVTGLTKDDFVLLDEGKRQQITSITEQNNNLTTTAATPRPNLFTNRFEKSAPQPVLTVLVLDAYNTRYWDIQMMKTGQCPLLCNKVGAVFGQAEKFISQMHPEDCVAVYELADKLYLLQDFTNDAAAIQKGVNRGKEYESLLTFSWSQSQPVDMESFTMGAMHEIADRLAKIPGRKNLIWLGTGFPPVPKDDGGIVITYDNIGKTSKILANADFPLFAIDANGLVPYPPGGGPVPRGGRRGPSGGDGPTPSGGSHGVGATLGYVPKVGDFEYSKSLADDSGGRAFYDTNDFAGAIRKVIDDSASTYILSYYPDHNQWNGEFREIKVKVNRPGLEVRARKGYFAVADTASASEKDAEKIAEAIKSPLESTDLGFDVQADGFDVAGVRQLKLKITLDANQLLFQQQGDRWTDNVTEYWVQFDSEGRQISTHSQTINLRPSQDAYKQLLQQGLNFSETVALEKNTAEVRLVLRDAGNGAIGSVIIPLSRLFASAAAEPQTKK
jgi:VWFA-related protein